MAKSNRELCGINDVTLSSSISQRALRSINDVQQFGSYLAAFSGIAQLTKIFTGAKTIQSASHNIAQHEWEEFADAMGAVPHIVRTQVNTFSSEAALLTTGKENTFWKCMYNATR